MLVKVGVDKKYLQLWYLRPMRLAISFTSSGLHTNTTFKFLPKGVPLFNRIFPRRKESEVRGDLT